MEVASVLIAFFGIAGLCYRKYVDAETIRGIADEQDFVELPVHRLGGFTAKLKEPKKRRSGNGEDKPQ